MWIEESRQELQRVRDAWKTLEPYHAMIYFAPEARAAFTALGLKDYWMGYFASRSAATRGNRQSLKADAPT